MGSDLGFKYGAVINLFDFGDTKFPPHYEQYLYIKLTNTTKGTLNLQALLESETLIKKAKVFAEAEKIANKTAIVGVIGLCYVGLPLIRAFVRAGFRTMGFDNTKHIKQHSLFDLMEFNPVCSPREGVNKEVKRIYSIFIIQIFNLLNNVAQ